jgi:hypothetical protein
VTSVRGVDRAELVFEGVEQAGPSFEGRVFLNNPKADDATEPTPENGYAGSFYVYGYGEPMPPDVAEARQRGETGVIAPIEKRIDADVSAIEGDELTVTVVAVPSEPGGSVPETPLEKVGLVAGRPR